MIEHHPGDDLLIGLAAGSLPAGPTIVVGAHVEGCAHCAGRVAGFESVGGALLEALPAVPLAPEALARTLARIDAAEAQPAESPPPRPALPAGAVWPRSLGRAAVSRWHWLGPGMRWARVTVPREPAANVFLLRIGPGKSLPVHTHSDAELTQVLHGEFEDGRGRYRPGDFDETDPSVRHQPVTLAGGECICLAAVEGRILFDGAVARAFGALIGM